MDFFCIDFLQLAERKKKSHTVSIKYGKTAKNKNKKFFQAAKSI